MAFKFLALSVLVATLAIGTHGQGILGNLVPGLLGGNGGGILSGVLDPVTGLLKPVTGILEPVLNVVDGPNGVLGGILNGNVLLIVKALGITNLLQQILAVVVELLQTVLALLGAGTLAPEVEAVLDQVRVLLYDIVGLVVGLIPQILLGAVSGGTGSSAAPTGAL